MLTPQVFKRAEKKKQVMEFPRFSKQLEAKF
jgi:hypothetical protein